MNRCPHCQRGNLESDGVGWLCDFCGEYFTDEELIIYDRETNENQNPDTNDNAN